MVHILLALIYLAFISLGLPDALLGATWPTMYLEFDTPIAFMGIVAFIIAMCTALSSLGADFINKKIPSGVVVAISVCVTAVALTGFSFSTQFYMLCIWAIPYGLGAGCIDATLNNYVALNYSAKHMSWLHSMWGIGAVLGPLVMGQVLVSGAHWSSGYLALAIAQGVLAIIFFTTLPIWKRVKHEKVGEEEQTSALENSPKGSVIFIVICFFCYLALEQTAIQWASSYLVLEGNLSEDIGATCAVLFVGGMTVGRVLSGFLTSFLSDKNLVRIGMGLAIFGCILLALPFGIIIDLVALFLMGLGCAPVYPSLIHATPKLFGKKQCQKVIGLEMAGATLGGLIIMPFFGVLAEWLSVVLLPYYLIVFAIAAMIVHEALYFKR